MNIISNNSQYRNLPDRPKEACGIFAIYGHEEAAKLTYFGLYALQHRGQESAGIVSSDGSRLFLEQGMGPVGKGFSRANLGRLGGGVAIGPRPLPPPGGPFSRLNCPALSTRPGCSATRRALTRHTPSGVKSSRRPS